MKDSQEKIDDEHRRLAQASNGGYAQKQEECQQAANDAAAAGDEFRRHNERESELQASVREAEQEESAARNVCEAKKHDVSQAENRLQALRREDGQRQSGFHEKMPTLLKAIENERSFTERPVGPIGHHVTLLKPKWSSILETSFGATLSSFIVASKRDMNILSGIMRRVNW